jgi:hypothetical protein
MARFTVHLPKTGAMNERLERAVFVRDGFTFGAFGLGGWWFILNGYLLVAFLLFFAYGLFVWLLVVLGVVSLIFPITFVLAVLLGFEAASLQRWALARRGFTEAGVISGDAGDALEQRFFAQYLADTPPATPQSSRETGSGFGGSSVAQNTAIGLFPQPNKPYPGFGA